MKRVFPLLFLATTAGLSGPAAGQDKSAALDKARTKFEAEVAKADEALVASLDKALAKAQGAGNKPMIEKLTYERELFVGKRIIPAAVPSTTYLKQRAQAVAALEAVYLPAIKELAKAKKEEEAEALEGALSDLLKSARGYGLALPALEGRPTLLIEHKGTGLVLESEVKDGLDRLVLAAKSAKRKPAQLWQLDREEKGVTIRNVAYGKSLSSFGRFEGSSGVGLSKLDPQKEVPDRSLFQLSEVRREVVIASLSKGESGSALTATDRKLKGVTVYDLVLDKSESPPTSGQLWVVTEVK